MVLLGLQPVTANCLGRVVSQIVPQPLAALLHQRWQIQLPGLETARLTGGNQALAIGTKAEAEQSIGLS